MNIRNYLKTVKIDTNIVGWNLLEVMYAYASITSRGWRRNDD